MIRSDRGWRQASRERLDRRLGTPRKLSHSATAGSVSPAGRRRRAAVAPATCGFRESDQGARASDPELAWCSGHDSDGAHGNYWPSRRWTNGEDKVE